MNKKINFQNITLVIFSIISLLLTYNYNWWSSAELFTFHWWAGPEQIGYWYPIILFIFCGLLKIFGIRYISISLIILLIFYVSIVSFGPILILGIYWITSYAIGKYLLNIIKIKSENNTIIVSSIGFAVIGLLTTTLSHFPVNYPQLYLYLILIINSFLIRKLNIDFSKFMLSLSNIRANLYSIENNISLYFGIILVSIIIHLFLLSLMPDMAHDSLSTHLTIPRFITENHYWKYDINEFIWSVQPMGGDMLNVIPYMFGGQDGIRLLNISFLIATGLLIYQFSLSKSKDIKISVGFSLAFLSTPIIYYVMGGAFIEPSLLFFSGCFAYLLFSEKIEWLLVSIILGFAISIKFSALLFTLLLIPLYYIDIKSNKLSLSYKELTKIAILFIIFSSGNYVFAFIQTGNPIFPLMNEIFKSKFYTTSAFYNPTWANKDGINLIWTFIFDSKRMGEFSTSGTLGIFLSIFIPSVIIILISNIKKNIKLIFIFLIFILFITIMFQKQAYLRYILPAIPVAYFVSIALISTNKYTHSILVAILSIIIGINFIKSTSAASAFRPAPAEFYLSNQGRQNFLAEQLPLAPTGEFLKMMPEYRNKKILLIGYAVDPIYYYFPSGTLAYSWHSLSVYDSINKNGGDISYALNEMGIDIIVCPFETNSNDKNKFTEQCKEKTSPIISTDKVYVGKVLK